jgi:colanic acid/amylovoran biosynthesis protein
MKRYYDAIISFTKHLVKRYNADVIFLSTCQGIDGYHDDSQVAMAIKDRLPADTSPHVHINSDFHRPDELMEHLRTFDWVVATRMHFAILALGVGTPVLPIAYEFKTEELFKSLGCDPEIPQIESLTAESLISPFDKNVESYASDIPKIRSAVASARRQAWQVAGCLSETFPEHVQTELAERQQITAASRRLGGQVPTTASNA